MRKNIRKNNMITIDIILPYYGEILKYSCEDNLLTDTLMEQLAVLFSDRPQAVRSWLCDVGEKHLLKHDQTLKESGLADGSSLIMV